MINWNKTSETPPPKDGSEVLAVWEADKNTILAIAQYGIRNERYARRIPSWMCRDGGYNAEDPTYWSEINWPGEI